jgi:hypothetical protein
VVFDFRRDGEAGCGGGRRALAVPHRRTSWVIGAALALVTAQQVIPALLGETTPLDLLLDNPALDAGARHVRAERDGRVAVRARPSSSAILGDLLPAFLTALATTTVVLIAYVAARNASTTIADREIATLIDAAAIVVVGVRRHAAS